jgi:hypothetical protein
MTSALVPEILMPASISESDRELCSHLRPLVCCAKWAALRVRSLTQACLVVGLDNVTLDNLAGTDTTVVRALGSRETQRGPAEGAVVKIKQSVLLLETEPGLVLGVGLHHLVGLIAVVELVGGAVGVPALGQDDDVGGAAEGVGEDSDGAQVDVGVVAGGLLGGGAIEVPGGEIGGLVLFLVQGLLW